MKYKAPSLFHLDVMNKTVANFHKIVVTTFKVHTVFYGAVFCIFSCLTCEALYAKHGFDS